MHYGTDKGGTHKNYQTVYSKNGITDKDKIAYGAIAIDILHGSWTSYALIFSGAFQTVR